MKVLITSAVGKTLRILLIGSFKIFGRILRIDGRVNTNLQLKNISLQRRSMFYKLIHFTDQQNPECLS